MADGVEGKRAINAEDFAELAIIENRSNKKALSKCSGLLISGGTDGTRTRDPCVTGRYSNRLNYRSTEFLRFITTGCHPGLLQFDAWQFLLSHGETPHYHRRYGVSLLSSAWGQVGPPR